MFAAYQSNIKVLLLYTAATVALRIGGQSKAERIGVPVRHLCCCFSRAELRHLYFVFQSSGAAPPVVKVRSGAQMREDKEPI